MPSPEKICELESADSRDNTQYGYKKDFKTALPQVIAVSVKNLLLLVYGMTLGFPTILIPAMKSPIKGEILHLSDTEISWLGSMNLIVVPLGCAMSGVITASVGRRRAMQMVNLPLLIAWLLFHYSTKTDHLYAALFLTGLAGGLLEAPVLTYVAEITQPHLRGALTATSSMCVIFGIFTQFLFGLFLYWRTVALVNIFFTVISVITLCFIPESPHWLVSRKRIDDARKSLQWLRGWTVSDSVGKELHDIQTLYYKTPSPSAEEHSETLMDRVRPYTERSFVLPFLLVSLTFFVGHFSGMTTFQTYAVVIFEALDAPLDKYYATLILGVLQLIGASVCVTLVHYTGKRPLTLFSTAGAAVCCLLVATYDFVKKSQAITLSYELKNVTTVGGDKVDVTFQSYSWMPLALLMLLALITHTGIRLLPWILIGEVYSAKTRAGAAGLSGAVGYIFGFLTNKLFIGMMTTLSIWGTYGLYGLVCIIGLVIFYFTLPETEGKTLNEIENHFAGVKKLTNEVYRSRKTNSGYSTRINKMEAAVNLAFEDDNSKL